MLKFVILGLFFYIQFNYINSCFCNPKSVKNINFIDTYNNNTFCNTILKHYVQMNNTCENSSNIDIICQSSYLLCNNTFSNHTLFCNYIEDMVSKEQVKYVSPQISINVTPQISINVTPIKSETKHIPTSLSNYNFNLLTNYILFVIMLIINYLVYI